MLLSPHHHSSHCFKTQQCSSVKVIGSTLFFLQKQRPYKLPLEICWEIICSNFSPCGWSPFSLIQSSVEGSRERGGEEKPWFICPLILTLHSFRDSCDKAIFHVPSPFCDLNINPFIHNIAKIHCLSILCMFSLNMIPSPFWSVTSHCT